jgi:CheY-like chemotaxis protein
MKPWTKPFSIWLADDRPEILELIAQLIEHEAGCRCVRQFPCAEAVLEALAGEDPPDAMVLDVNMGGMTGVEAVAPVKRMAPGTRVFVMTTFYDSMIVLSAREAGADGFLLKSDDWQRAVERIMDPDHDWWEEVAAPVCAQWGLRASDAESLPALTVPLAVGSARDAAQTGPAPVLAHVFAAARKFFNGGDGRESSLPREVPCPLGAPPRAT